MAIPLAIVSSLVGCSSNTPNSSATPPAVPGGKPLAGVRLVVACPEPVLAGRLSQQAKAWAGRYGAAVQVTTKPWGESPEADIVVLPPAELGGASAELATLPVAFKANEHQLSRGRIAESYRDTLTTWGGEVQGLPLTADGFVLIFRADRFAAEPHRGDFPNKYGRPLAAPRTWEDIADIAAYFHAADGKPSLPPLPAAEPLLTQFQQLAVCYDRKAEGDTEGGQGGRAEATLGLHYDPGTGAARFARPSFVAAAKWFADTQKFRATPKPGESDDPVAALDTGTAVMAVLSLLDVNRLPRDPVTGAIPGKFGVTALPGTRGYFDADGQPRAAAGDGNYVPFLGTHTLIGAVRKRCQNPQVAWDFLADLARPTGSSATLSDPATGSGPFRREHVDEANDPLWLGYKFDTAGSRDLAQALRKSLALNVANPTTALRLPDHAARLGALEVTVRAVATGKLPPAAGMAQATEAWRQLDAKAAPESLPRQRRNALGLP